MKQVDKISVKELTGMAEKMFYKLVKAVVDVERRVVVVDAEMHYDEEQFLLQQGSKNGNLWGVNLYPAEFGTDKFIEFDSMINVRPGHGNDSRGVDDPALRQTIIKIVSEVVHE